MLNPQTQRSAFAGFAFLLGASGLSAGGTGPFSADALVPSIDRWMYPHNQGAGAEQRASTYSALPLEAGVDDRFAQFIVKFNTVAAGIKAGLGPQNYDPSKVVFTAVVLQGGVPYDPTEDSRLTYGPNAVADTDAGRPIELHGVGFRGTATSANFTENNAFGSGAPGGRNAYAMGYSPEGVARDVSNNVTQGFDSMPWAVAKIMVKSQETEEYEELPPGQTIPPLAHAVFELNLSNPGVADYVRQSLHQGYIWLAVTSLHSVSEMAASGYPAFYTKENVEHELFGDVAASIQIDYSLPLNIVSIQRDDVTKTASVSWNGSPGFSYVLEKSETLEPGSWLPVQTFTTPTPTTLNWNGSSASNKAFFRVARTEQP